MQLIDRMINASGQHSLWITAQLSSIPSNVSPMAAGTLGSMDRMDLEAPAMRPSWQSRAGTAIATLMMTRKLNAILFATKESFLTI